VAPPRVGAGPKPYRNRINSQVTQAGAVVRINFQLADISTGGTGLGVQGQMIRPDQISSVAPIADMYQFWRLRSLHYKWYPYVGATIGGNVRISAFTNPEIIGYGINSGYTAAEVGTMVSTSPYNKGFAAYSPFEWAVPVNLLNRRRWYSCDSTAPGGDYNTTDRTTPALVLTYIAGENSTKYGYWQGIAVFEFKDIIFGITVAPLFAARGSLPDEYFQAPDGSWYHRHDGVIDLVDGPPLINPK